MARVDNFTRWADKFTREEWQAGLLGLEPSDCAGQILDERLANRLRLHEVVAVRVLYARAEGHVCVCGGGVGCKAKALQVSAHEAQACPAGGVRRPRGRGGS